MLASVLDLWLGLGRGDHSYLRSEGIRTQGFQGLCDYVDIIRRLWSGQTVSYDGLAARYDGIKLGDVYEDSARRCGTAHSR
jgi:5,10-methylenetetrahydromethanopterin reductase